MYDIKYRIISSESPPASLSQGASCLPRRQALLTQTLLLPPQAQSKIQGPEKSLCPPQEEAESQCGKGLQERQGSPESGDEKLVAEEI